jgi:hypothetical protein
MEILKKYLPKAIFCAFGLKLLVLNQDWSTVGAFCVSGLVFLTTEYLNNKKNIHIFEQKLMEQETKLQVFEDKIDKFSDSLGTLQVARGFKPISIK